MKKTLANSVSSSEKIFEYLKSFKIKKVFDLGANIGMYSVLFAKNWPEAEIHSFEPVYSNYLEILKNLKLNSITNVLVNNFGIYVENCEKEMSIPLERDQENSGLYSVKVSGNNPQKCNFYTLNYYLDKQKIEGVDFVKMDVEGCEEELLRANPDFFKKLPFLSIEINNFFSGSKGIKDCLREYDYEHFINLDRNTELWGHLPRKNK